MISKSAISALYPPPPKPPPERLRIGTLRAAISNLIAQRVAPVAIVWAPARDGHRETRLYLCDLGGEMQIDEADPALAVALSRGEAARQVNGPRLLLALHTDRCTVELPPPPFPAHETRRITVGLGHAGLPFEFEFAVPVLAAGRAP